MAKDNGVPITPESVHEAYEKQYAFQSARHVGDLKRSTRCSKLIIGIVLVVLGVICLGLGLFGGVGLPSIVTSTIKSGVATCELKEETARQNFMDSYGNCENCVPYYSAYFGYNITNAEAVLANPKVKLAIQEIGPYSFRKFTKKTSVKFNSDSTLSYKSYNEYEFVPSRSCPTCKLTDVITTFDVGYMNVMSQAGGEKSFVKAIISAKLGMDAPDSLVSLLQFGVIKLINGLNSFHPTTTILAGAYLETFFKTYTLPKDEDLTDFSYNGIFVKRNIRQTTLGYPSLLAGLAVVGQYISKCKGKADVLALCDKCKDASLAATDECIKSKPTCGTCSTGANVLKLNQQTCSIFKSSLTENGMDTVMAGTITSRTCGGALCTDLGLCAAPLPGALDSFDWKSLGVVPSEDMLTTTTYKTGCDNLDNISQYVMNSGYTSTPIWNKQDGLKNPSVSDIIKFSSKAYCNKPQEDVTCTPVQGGDGASFKPVGAGINGLAKSYPAQSVDLFISQAYQNITLVNTNENVMMKNITLQRFVPPTDVLTRRPWNQHKGTGIPYNGVQNLAYTSGFLAYVSQPMYLFGDKELLESIDLTMLNGKKATMGELYSDGSKALKKEYNDIYGTFIDIEPTTGKTMNAFKRLQASFAMNKSPLDASKSLSDVVYPSFVTEVVTPMYWIEEHSEIPDKLASQFTSKLGVAKVSLPMTIVGLIAAAILIVAGAIFIRKHKVQLKAVNSAA